MPQQPNGPPWPDISKGLDGHQAENYLTQRDSALADRDLHKARWLAAQQQAEATQAAMQKQIDDLGAQVTLLQNQIHEAAAHVAALPGSVING